MSVYVCAHAREKERDTERGGQSEWNPVVACLVATFFPVACFIVNCVTCGICRIVIFLHFCCSL